jgi:hypothetical protein
MSEDRQLAAFWRKGLNLTTRALYTVKMGMDFTIPQFVDKRGSELKILNPF